MALQLWMPLTKDLRQQGISSIIPTQTTGYTSIAAGKLGGCYKFTGTFDTLLPFSDWNWTEGSVSFGCWAKISQSELATLVNAQTYDATYNSMGGTLLGRDSYGGLGLRWKTNNIYTDSTLNAVYVYTHIRNTSSSSNNTNTYTIPFDTWFHVMMVLDRVNSKINIYINGELFTSANLTVTGSFTTGTFRIAEATWDGGNGKTSAGCWQLNDVRVYDNALSPMEVKYIAQGLVLHYPLNRQGWGQENLVWNSNWNVHSTTPPESWVNWGSPPTREIVTIDGKNWLHVISNTTQFQGYSQNWTKRNGVGELTANTKMTVSFTAKLATAASIAPIGIHWCNSSGTIVTQNWTTTALTTNPKRYSFTYTTPADCVAFNIMVGDNTNTAHEVWVTDIKLEFGEVATPWCPNSADALATTMGLNSTTEYDCSGFCNNGIRTGTFTWTSDTPKYQVSTKFSQSRIQCNGDFLYGLSTATLSAWVKLTAYHSERCMVVYANGRYLTINNNGQLSGYSYGKTPAGYYNSSQTIPLNTWTHITIVWDDTTWYFYINGILVNSWACTGTFTNVGSYASVGQESNGGRSVSGLISDARVYATALSADDVKSLYQNCATIDADGTIHGQIRS